MENDELIKLVLPEGILDFFALTHVEKQSDSYTIHLEEKNIHPESYKSNKLESKGFYEPATIQDFPLRGKACYLKVKRRRWLNLDTGTIVARDWDMVAKGTRLTVEFATFLKELNRYNTGKYS
jgi:hypothetical protein